MNLRIQPTDSKRVTRIKLVCWLPVVCLIVFPLAMGITAVNEAKDIARIFRSTWNS